MISNGKPPFDPKVFLAKVNGGRAISDYRKEQRQTSPASSTTSQHLPSYLSRRPDSHCVCQLSPRRIRASRFSLELNSRSTKSSSTRLLRTKRLLLANFGKEGRPDPIIAKISQETLAEMIGTTRSRV